MKAQFEDSDIKNHWTSQALRHGSSHHASWSDTQAIELEKNVLLGYLQEDSKILDIGCSNGHATLTYAHRKSIDITGMDYVPEMIAAARENLAENLEYLRGKVHFKTGDIRELPFADATFDTVMTTRVVINLQNWDAQIRGISECFRVAKPGGIVLLSEATIQGLAAINRLRDELGMQPLSMPAFNLYLDSDKMVSRKWGSHEPVEVVDFSSTYYLLTRVFKPVLELLPDSKVKAIDPRSEVNRLSGMLPAWGDYGVQKLFILRKKN